MVDTPTIVTYCTVDDVRRIIQSSVKFADDDKPSSEDIRKMITSAENEINRRTRHAWKSVTVTNEYHDYPVPVSTSHIRDGMPIKLDHRAVTQFTSGTDKIEIWDGSAWTDWVATKVEGRSGDFWVDYTNGVIYLRHLTYYFQRKAIRVTYRYGEAAVPEAVRDATAFLVAADVIMNDDSVQLLNETGSNGFQMTIDMKAKAFENRAERKLREFMEFFAV